MNASRRSEPFRCTRLQEVVGEETCEITVDLVEHRSKRSAHESAIRVPSGINCDSTRGCGVEDARGNFNWTLCVHPILHKQAS